MNFNWSTMKKEQKQVLLLAVMWIFGGLFALYQFVLVPFLRSHGDSSGELEELQSQIVKAQVAMDSEAKVHKEFDEITKALRASVNQYVVPKENSLSWATEKIYESARIAGVDVRSVSDVSQVSAEWKKALEAGRVFKPYGVRIEAESTYAELLSLIGALEMKNPFVVITGITVMAQDQNPLRPKVSLLVEWPIWGCDVDLEVARLKDNPREEVN